MEPSPRKKNLYAAAAAAVVVVLILSSEMASAAADTGFCKHLSGSFRGLCFDDDNCSLTCKDERKDNIGGLCLDFIPHCFCFSHCSPP
ncbi:unnamed protein product [Urochloa decumbens]|uniref:Knottins-like domain-containing protein n=1 Tax=Urochloa decumbens TaxID=240449 RepID=A0ABC9B3H0_9POAL